MGSMRGRPGGWIHHSAASGRRQDEAVASGVYCWAWGQARTKEAQPRERCWFFAGPRCSEVDEPWLAGIAVGSRESRSATSGSAKQPAQPRADRKCTC